MEKKGFILAEAILAITLVSASMLMKAQYDKEENQIKEAGYLASSLIDVVSAIDRRIFLDGVHKVDGWNESWTRTNDVIDKFFAKELVASANPDCGVVGGWIPRDPANGALELLQCGFMQGGRIPFNLQMSAERSGSTSNFIHNWKVNFYSDTEKNFKENFKYYTRVVSESQSRKSPSITGSFRFYLADLATGKKLKPNECLTRTTKCAITAEYETNRSGLSEDLHLRVDGTNSMLDSLTFRAPIGGNLLGCKRSSYNGTGITDVPCGIEMLADDKVAVNINDSFTGEGLRLSSSLTNGGNVYAPVICSKGSEDRVCGITSVKVGGSTYAEAYLDSIYAESIDAKTIKVNSGSLSLINSNLTIGKKRADGSVQPMASIESNSGNITTLGYASVGDLFASRKVTTNQAQIQDAKIAKLEVTGGGVSSIFQGESSFIGRAKFNSDMEVRGKAYMKQDLHVDNILSSNVLNVKDYVYIAQKRREGSSCSHSGSIGRESNGELLNCVGGLWQKVGSSPFTEIFEGAQTSVIINKTGFYIAYTSYGTSSIYVDDLSRVTYGSTTVASNSALGVRYDPSVRAIRGTGRHGTPTIYKLFYSNF